MTERNTEVASQRRRHGQMLPGYGMFHVLLRAIFIAAATGLMLAVGSGCMTLATTWAGNLLAARKAESLQGWETATLDGRPLRESIGARVAMLIANADSVSVEIRDSELLIKGGRKAEGTYGSAAPVSDDGYFLTAAHVIEGVETLQLVVGSSMVDGRTGSRGIPARVVWKSEIAAWADEDSSRGELLPVTDVAIVHAQLGSLPPIVPFRLAGTAPEVGDPVIMAGWSLLHVGKFHEGARLAAGKIVSVQAMDARRNLPAFVTVHHDAPVAGGDSGGPLLDRSGKLVGITSISPVNDLPPLQGSRRIDDAKHRATANMPDPKWLRDLIENDRLRRNAGEAPPNQGTVRD